MAAATSSPRPLSLFQPPTSSHPFPVDQSTPLRRTRSPVTSHYRPFSLLISEPPSEPRRRSIFRSPSFASMGFSFMDRSREKDKAKGKEKEKEEEQGYPRKISLNSNPSNISPNRSEPHLTLSPRPPKHTDRPSTSSGLFTLPREKGLKKKRSLSSLLSAATSESTTGTNTPSSRSGSLSPVYLPHTHSPLGTSDSVQLDESNAKDDVTIKAAEVEKPRPRRRSANFIRKNTWLKRQNMNVHPYPLEAPYMQAYEPLQLEKWGFSPQA
jgi:hypothetical protein